jgi:hypothetical protein
VTVVRALTPVALEEGLVQCAVQFAAGCLIELPVATPSLAEVLAAAADRRDLRPRAPKLAVLLMRGEGELNHAVEGGKSQSASVDLIRQHLIGQYVDSWLLPGRDEKEKDQLVRDKLERLASGDLGDGPFRHFFIYESSGAVGQRSASELIALDLNERFPQIRTLALTRDRDREPEELGVSDLLVDLFLSHDQQKAPADHR